MAARSGILGLGSRLYPGNMQRIFNKDLTQFMQSLSRERQTRASKRKALLAGWVLKIASFKFANPLYFNPTFMNLKIARPVLNAKCEVVVFTQSLRQ